VKYSQDLSQVSGISQWYATNFNTPTVPASPPTDPFGGTSASWKLVATAGAGYHVWRFAATYAADTYTFSFWAKAAEYNRVVLSDVGTGRGGCAFVLTGNGTATVIAGGVTPTNPTIVPYANGWYRCSVTMTMTAAAYGIGIAGYPVATTPDAFGASYTADGTSGVYATGMQVELGSGASSYIPTGASQGTREADSAVMNDIAPLNYSTTNGSIYWSGIINKQPTSYITLIGFMTAIDEPAYETFGNALSYFTAARGPTLNIGGANEISRTYVLGSLIKYASSVNTLANPIVAVNLNGSASSVTKSGTGDLRVATRFVLGRQPSSTYGANYPSVTIRSIKYWPTTKTAAELAVLTA
jgi:hypothetical protein